MPEMHECFEHLGMGTDEGAEDDQEQADGAIVEQASVVETFCDGKIVVYTDGACANNQDSRIRRAGCAAYWALGHDLNISAPLVGPDQTNQRAELMAALAVLRIERRPCQIRTDSKYVYDICNNIINNKLGIAALVNSHRDLWAEVEALIRARPPGAVSFTKVKGHASTSDVRRNLISHADRIGNHMADILARRAVAQIEFDEIKVNRLKNKTKLAGQVQRMMVEILAERQAKLQRSASTTELFDTSALELDIIDLTMESSEDDVQIVSTVFRSTGLHPHPMAGFE